MKTLIIDIIQDQDYKVVKTLLDRLGVSYRKKTIPEDDDPILSAEAERVKNDRPLGAKESEAITKKIKAIIKRDKGTYKNL